jgi:hypothetical protein
MRALRALVVLILCAAQWGCDSCSALSSCSGGPYLALGGQIVDPATGRGIDGIRLDVRPAAGVAVREGVITTTTAGGGFWRAEFSPEESGTFVADVTVAPPDLPPYQVSGLRLETRPNRGDAHLNERWIPYLYFLVIGEFYRNGTADDRVEGAAVEFRRTGGVTVVGPGFQNGVYRSVTNGAGRVVLFPAIGATAVNAVVAGELIGDLVVRLPASADSTVIRGVHLATRYRYDNGTEFPPVLRAPVGP